VAAIYQRGKKGIWWIKYYVAGKPVYYSLRTTNARAAERIKKQIEGDEAKGELLAPSRTPLPELLEDYCQFMGTFRTPKPCSADVSILRIVFGPITPALELGSHVNRRFRTDSARRARDTLVPRHILAKHLEDVTGRVLEDFITTRIREDGISATRSSSWTASSSPNGTRRKGHRGNDITWPVRLKPRPTLTARFSRLPFERLWSAPANAVARCYVPSPPSRICSSTAAAR